ncbi:MAG: restriction endonuclease subunit S [Aeromonas sobria]|uniref:restriction endonuclease subunit S n=1 Tax=Aeromonas sobria TaxID=646 RepID=UPI003F416D8A
MGSNWPLIRLGDFVQITTGHPFKSNEYSETAGVKLLRGDNVVQGALRWQNVKMLPEDKIGPKEKNYYLRAGDVILAMDRPWIEAGLKTAQVNESDLPCLLVQRVACLRCEEPSDQDFIRYIISSYSFVQYIQSIQTGTAIPHISGKQIKDFEFRLPPKNIRKKIGAIIKQLDDKSHLNRQINQTLEQMAQALFKSWFMDFDPVVDNALDAGFFEQNLPFSDELLRHAEARRAVREQRDFKPLPEATRQLFPVVFEECVEPSLGLGGWVPQGWHIAQLSKVAKVATGKRPPSKGTQKTKDEPIPVWGGNGIKWFTNIALTHDKHIITGRVGTLGTVYKVNGPSWASDNSLVIRPLKNCFYEFVFQTLSLFDINSLNSGSTQPLVTQTALNGITFILPDNDELFIDFQMLADNYDLKIELATIETDTLVKIRDTLLPKLMSGEIDVEGSL